MSHGRGGRWRGWLVGYDLITGEAVVDCTHIDIGYGWRELPSVERRWFDAERVEVEDAR